MLLLAKNMPLAEQLKRKHEPQATEILGWCLGSVGEELSATKQGTASFTEEVAGSCSFSKAAAQTIVVFCSATVQAPK